MRNARLAFELEWKHPRKQSQEILRALRDLLDLEVEPQPHRVLRHLEHPGLGHRGLDGGASRTALPKKSDYRKFRIRSVTGAPDDFASMREVVGRRYKRLLEEGKELPDLVLIDGGKGQLGAAVEALEELGLGDQPVASLAKREELIFVRGRDEPIALPRYVAGPAARPARARRGPPLRHRLPPPDALAPHLAFGARRHPGRRPSQAAEAALGFGSVRGVRGASEAELAGVVGKSSAARLRAHFDGASAG